MNGINRIDKMAREMSTNSVNASKAVDKKSIQDTFKTKLGELKQEEIRVKLETLYSDIEEQTSRLQDSLFIDDLVKYKKLVKEFLDISVNNSHVFFKENSLDRRGRHRVFSLVKKVDLELDQLTEDFLQIESNRIDILKRLDNISGILMDIMT